MLIMDNTDFNCFGTSSCTTDKKKAFRTWLSLFCKEMEEEYRKNIENGMTTVDGICDFGQWHYVCVECTSLGNKVEIYNMGNKECCYPNIERAILDSLPVYSAVLRMVDGDRLEEKALKDTYRNICQSNGWDYSSCNIY